MVYAADRCHRNPARNVRPCQTQPNGFPFWPVPRNSGGTLHGQPTRYPISRLCYVFRWDLHDLRNLDNVFWLGSVRSSSLHTWFTQRIGVIAILLETYAHVKHNRTVSRFGRYRETAVVHSMGSERGILCLDYFMFSGGVCMIFRM